jgi:hypothetical protein
MKIYQVVQKLLLGDTQTDRQTDTKTGSLMSLLSFLERRLKSVLEVLCDGLKHIELHFTADQHIAK